MSFILDALRKSEHERQRSTAPGLSQVPMATPEPQLPRWALIVIGMLGATVLALGAAWWQSSRAPAAAAAVAPPTVERNVDLPPPRATERRAPPGAGEGERSLAAAAASSAVTTPTDAPAEAAARIDLPADAGALQPAQLDLPADAAALPSVAALLAEGVVLPPLRLELHAYSAEPGARFVFINGRKYLEGERITEGPQVVAIVPTGAVLAHAGRRFVIVQE